MGWKLFDVSMPANESIGSHGHFDGKEAHLHGNFKHPFHCQQSVHSTSPSRGLVMWIFLENHLSMVFPSLLWKRVMILKTSCLNDFSPL